LFESLRFCFRTITTSSLNAVIYINKYQTEKYVNVSLCTFISINFSVYNEEDCISQKFITAVIIRSSWISIVWSFLSTANNFLYHDRFCISRWIRYLFMYMYQSLTVRCATSIFKEIIAARCTLAKFAHFEQSRIIQCIIKHTRIDDS